MPQNAEADSQSQISDNSEQQYTETVMPEGQQQAEVENQTETTPPSETAPEQSEGQAEMSPEEIAQRAAEAARQQAERREQMASLVQELGEKDVAALADVRQRIQGIDEKSAA